MTVTPDSSLYYISVTRPAFVYDENGNFLADTENRSTNGIGREKTDYTQTSGKLFVGCVPPVTMTTRAAAQKPAASKKANFHPAPIGRFRPPRDTNAQWTLYI